MGAGTRDFKKIPTKKTIYGNSEFFLRPLTLGLGETYESFIIRPPMNEGYKLCIEGEFGVGESQFRDYKKAYKEKIVHFAYYESELLEFNSSIRKEIVSHCTKVLKG